MIQYSGTSEVDPNEPCVECKLPLRADGPRPAVGIRCLHCRKDHYWHAGCVPPHIQAEVDQANIRRWSELN